LHIGAYEFKARQSLRVPYAGSLHVLWIYVHGDDALERSGRDSFQSIATSTSDDCDARRVPPRDGAIKLLCEHLCLPDGWEGHMAFIVLQRDA